MTVSTITTTTASLTGRIVAGFRLNGDDARTLAGRAIEEFRLQRESPAGFNNP